MVLGSKSTDGSSEKMLGRNESIFTGTNCIGLLFDLDKAHSESPFERFYREQREKLDSEEQSKKFHEYHEESAKRSRDEYQAKNNQDAWAKIRDAGGVPRKRSQ